MDGLTYRSCGPRAGIVDCPPESCLPIADALRATGDYVDIVPAESSVFVSSNARIDQAVVLALAQLHRDSAGATTGRHLEIPVRYTGDDLGEVASTVGMSVEAVIDLHTSTSFTAAFAGFAPGFLYCTGLPKQLHLPRRSQPRVRVPSGSVAIADIYSAVYPMESPGGWHLLGTTDISMFDLGRDPASYLQPGDTVRFVQVRP